MTRWPLRLSKFPHKGWESPLIKYRFAIRASGARESHLVLWWIFLSFRAYCLAHNTRKKESRARKKSLVDWFSFWDDNFVSSFTRLRTSLIDFSTSPSLSLVKKIILQLSDLRGLGRAGFPGFFGVGVLGIIWALIRSVVVGVFDGCFAMLHLNLYSWNFRSADLLFQFLEDFTIEDLRENLWSLFPGNKYLFWNKNELLRPHYLIAKYLWLWIWGGSGRGVLENWIFYLEVWFYEFWKGECTPKLKQEILEIKTGYWQSFKGRTFVEKSFTGTSLEVKSLHQTVMQVNILLCPLYVFKCLFFLKSQPKYFFPHF